MVFIPKESRCANESEQDFRPISFIFVMLKTVERVVDIHLSKNMEKTPFSKAQHSYFEGDSNCSLCNDKLDADLKASRVHPDPAFDRTK